MVSQKQIKQRMRLLGIKTEQKGKGDSEENLNRAKVVIGTLLITVTILTIVFVIIMIKRNGG